MNQSNYRRKTMKKVSLLIASIAASAVLHPLHVYAQSSDVWNLSHNSSPAPTARLWSQSGPGVRAQYVTLADILLGTVSSTDPRLQIYDVRSFGALCDNSTDDLVAIQAAIDAAGASGGGYVHIPSGTQCRISGTLNITSKGVRIVGDGPGASTIRTSSTTADMIRLGTFSGSSNFSPCGGVSQLTLGSSVTRTAGFAVAVDGCEDGELSFLRIATTGGGGIDFSPLGHDAGIFRTHNMDVEITGAFDGIRLEGGSSAHYFTDLWLRGSNTAGSIGVHIPFSSGDNFTNVGAAQFEVGFKIDPSAASGQSVTWETAHNGSADTNTSIGWQFTGTGQILSFLCSSCWSGTNGPTVSTGRGFKISNGDHIELTGVRAVNNGGAGIEISGGVNIKVAGGLVTGNSNATTNTADGVSITNSDHVRITGLSSRPAAGEANNQRYGMSISTGVTNLYVAGNDLVGNVTGSITNTGGLSSSLIFTQNVPITSALESYLFGLGVPGGQTLNCGTAAGESCTFHSTSNATKGLFSISPLTINEATGRVGLGTASPNVALAVSANAATLPAPGTGTLIQIANTDATAARIGVDGFGAGGVPGIVLRRSQGTAASPSVLTSANSLGTINWAGRAATVYSSDQAAIGAETAEAWSDTAQGTNWFVSTTDVGTTTLSRKLTITAAGHWLVQAAALPAVACTGTGTSPAAPTIAGTDTAFTITVNTGTGSPGNTGTCTVTFGAAYITNKPVIICTLQDGASSWSNEAVVRVSSSNLSAPILTWTNEASGVLTGLAVSSSYQINCVVIGK